MPNISVPSEELIGQLEGYVAGEDLSSHQFCIMIRSAANTLIHSTNATDLPVGILLNKPTSGEACEIKVSGPCKMKVDGNAADITGGMRLVPGAEGVGHYSVTNLYRQVAVAADDSTADGDIIAVILSISDISLA